MAFFLENLVGREKIQLIHLGVCRI